MCSKCIRWSLLCLLVKTLNLLFLQNVQLQIQQWIFFFHFLYIFHFFNYIKMLRFWANDKIISLYDEIHSPKSKNKRLLYTEVRMQQTPQRREIKLMCLMVLWYEWVLQITVAVCNCNDDRINAAYYACCLRY